MADLAGRIAAVSGIASGFGRAISQAFVAAGARVHGCDVDEEGLAALACEGVCVSRIDLADRTAARGWVAAIGVVDILVNNAGGVLGQSGRPFDAVSDADWDDVIAVNLHAAAALCQAVIPAMTRSGRGAIVNIASGASLRASMTGVQAYCAAKHGLLGLTRQLAHELGPRGIRVNAVAPGFVVTNHATAMQWEGYGAAGRDAILDRIALRRLGTARDIAGAVSFLASDEAAFITGQILSVDGGQ